MARTLIFFLAGLLATARASSAVIDLTPSNFDKVVFGSGKPTLVEFFAPWCGHCKQLAPIYEELGTAYAHAKDQMHIAKVDADANRDLGARFKVHGYPTLKWFDGKSKTPVDYTKGHDFDSLSQFITEKVGVKPRLAPAPPSLVKMLSTATFPKTVGSSQHVLVAFTAPWCGHCKSLAPVWESLAKSFENEPDVVIAKVDAEAGEAKELASAQKVKSYPTIKFFPAGSSEPEPYSGGRQEEHLVTFLNQRAGTSRKPGGALDESAGTIKSLDDIVSQFAAGQSHQDSKAAVEKAMEGLPEKMLPHAKYYLRVLEKLKVNRDFPSKEHGRLDGILSRGVLAAARSDEMTSRKNILHRFVDAMETQPASAKDEL